MTFELFSRARIVLCLFFPTKTGSPVLKCPGLLIRLVVRTARRSTWVLKNKRRLHDRKTEHFKSITSSNHSSAIANLVTSTGHNMKWDHFDILARGRSGTHCKIKETVKKMSACFFFQVQIFLP